MQTPQTPQEPSPTAPSRQPASPSEETTFAEIIMAAGDAAMEEVKRELRESEPNGSKPSSPTSSSSSTGEKFVSKGPAWPADFSQDVPEYTDEELEREIKLAAKEK